MKKASLPRIDRHQALFRAEKTIQTNYSTKAIKEGVADSCEQLIRLFQQQGITDGNIEDLKQMSGIVDVSQKARSWIASILKTADKTRQNKGNR